MEKKQLISVVKPLIAAALLFGSSGGVAWGQTQMDCHNAFGAGESRWNNSPTGVSYIITASRNTSKVGEGDSWLPTNGTGAIIIGGTPANIVGEVWTGVDITPNPGGLFYTGKAGTNCIPSWSCGSGTCYGNWCYGASPSKSPQYTGCDNTWFRKHNSAYNTNSGTWIGNENFSSFSTIVNLTGSSLGGAFPVGTFSTNAFDLDMLHFKDIPFAYKLYSFAHVSHLCNNNSHSCTYNDAVLTETEPSGWVSEGHIVIDAGSHIHIRQNIGADGDSHSKAFLDLPDGGDQYSLMVDGNIDEAKVIAQGGAGAIRGLSSMAPKAVIGVHGNYLPGNGIATSAAGGTILIGPSTTGQNKMTITPASGGPNDAYAFDRITSDTTVYTGTWVPADGTSNLGNYGDHDITVDATMKIALPSTASAAAAGNMSTGKIQIFNMKKSLTYNNFLPNIPTAGSGNFLMLAADKLTMSTTSTHTSNIAGSGSMTLMGARVTLDKDELITLANGGSGNYNVIAYATRTRQLSTNPPTYDYPVGEAPGVGQFGPYGNTCSGTYPTCASSVFDAEKITTPWPNIRSATSPGISGTAYNVHLVPPPESRIDLFRYSLM